jgi:hypothetical protein
VKEQKMKRTASIIAAALMMVGASAGSAQAAPGDNGQGFGGCVQNFYGNTTNPRPGGNGVLPSQSPGPWVNNPADPNNPTMGISMGGVMQFLTATGIKGQDAQAVICLFP